MYTVEVYKQDRRTKSGERLVHKADYDTDNISQLEHSVRHTWRKGYRYEIHQTFVTRKNMMNGQENHTKDPPAVEHSKRGKKTVFYP